MPRWLFLLTLGACQTGAKPATTFAWLVGTWQHTESTTTTTERWVATADGSLLGSGDVSIGQGRIGFAETLAILGHGSEFIYVAWPVGQTTAQFAVRPDGANALVATRPGPDFPLEIRYALSSDGTLRVDATGPESHEPEHWTLSRSPAAP